MRQRGGLVRVRSGRHTGRWATRAVLSLLIVLVVAIPGTTAAWTDQVPVTGTTLTAGTADLRVDGSNAPSFTAMNASTMEGGDSTAGVLTVSNAGDVPLSYYVDASATNTDGKGLASQLAVKVTSNASTSGSSPTVTCAGSALASSGTSFSSGLLGSSSNRRSLGVGASETLCIQASLPDGTAALGGTTSITLTFTAITGTTGTPGWTDTVTTSGTTLTMINAFYLGSDVVNADATVNPSTPQPLKRTSPTKTTLFNYDRRDSLPGLLLNQGANGIDEGSYAKNMRWNLSVGASPLTVSGTAQLRIWSALKAWDSNKRGAVEVGLFDCDSTATTCTQLSGGTLDQTSWTVGGANVWTLKNFALTPSGSYTFAANRVVQVRVAALTASAVDVMFAYDTTTYKAALIITP